MAPELAELAEPVTALFSDVDGTLTTDGIIEAETYGAITRVVDAGIPVVLVTGRSAGWGQALAALWPVAAVVTENGGVTFVKRGAHLQKHYGLPEETLATWRQRMLAAVDEVKARVPGARLSTDSAYREVDLAFDWNEEAALGEAAAERIVDILRAAGLRAVQSSVHVNFCPPLFDKLSACRTVIAEVLGGDAAHLDPYLYVGDSLNDAPMFGGFPRSVGVANVRKWWDILPHHPAMVTSAAEGAGARQVMDAVLAVTQRHRGPHWGQPSGQH